MDEALLNSMRADATNRGMLAHISKTEGRILYTRNLLLILLSLVVGGRALLSILASWRSAALSPVRKFTHFLMGVLLTIELVQCIIWFLGMTFAALEDGSLPKAGTLDLKVAKKWCAPLGAITYWLDLMNSLWHAVVAWKVWSWVYRHQPVYVLCQNLIYMTVVVAALATGLTMVPLFERNLGLTPHSHCFLTTFWKKDGHVTTAYMLDRWILLPICWFAVAGFNCATIYVLKKEERFLPLSAQRLQLRLLLVTISFCVLWGLMAVPAYLYVRTFVADFLLRWNLAMGFVDAICYGFPESLDAARYVARRCPGLVRLLIGDVQARAYAERVHPSSDWVFMTVPGEVIPAGEGNRLSRWMRTFRLGSSSPTAPRPELYPHRIFLTTFDKSYQPLPKSNLLSLIHRNYLAEGLEQWLPLGGYHIYGIAVQKSRHLFQLREAIHDYLGGNARYTLVATAELNDATHTSKTALMLFVRTVDVESGAFRMIGLNKCPVRASRTGTKGLLGLSFRFYDQSIAIINAHLPTVGQYGGDEVYRARHVAAMLQELRINAEHELFDTHLQYHHVFLLGNLNSRTQELSPSEMLVKVVDSSKVCQQKLERVRHRGMDWNWRAAGYNRFWSTATGGVSGVPVFPLGPGGTINSDNLEEWKEGETKRHEEEGSWMATLEMGLRGAQHEVLEPLTNVMVRAWAWVKDVDGLLGMIRRGYVFTGFEEGPIVFPPTFKWNAGTTADDFNVPQVVAQAYNTQEADHPLLDVTPSYADRILYRSVPDMAHRLVLLAYDAVERGPLALIGDHRPVSAAFTLMLDTAHPLALYAGQFPRLSALNSDSVGTTPGPHVPRRQEEPTEMAEAMAGAARIRRTPMSPPHPIYERPVPQPAFPPLLITVCLSQFRFQFAAFKNSEGITRGGRGLGTPSLSCQHHHTTEGQGAGGQSRSRGASEEDVKEEETKEQRGTGDEGQTQQREASLSVPCPPCFRLPTIMRTSDSSELSWISGVTEEEYGTSGETDPTAAAAAAEAAASGAVKGLVEEVVVLYPLPCEDPLWCFRHYQALNESLKLGGRCGSPSHGTTRERTLRNLHQMRWNPDLEAHDEDGRPQDQEGRDTGHLEMDVMTLAPLPTMQHALIKFLGANKRELGQGVMSVRSDIFEEIPFPAEAVATPPMDSPPPPPSFPSLPRLLRGALSAASGGGSSSSYMGGRTTASFSSTAAVVMPQSTAPPSNEDSSSRPPAAACGGGGSPAKYRKERHCQAVTLSVGGDFRGTVEFACDVKIRRRAKDGGQLRVPEGDLQSSHGGEGRLAFPSNDSIFSDYSY